MSGAEAAKQAARYDPKSVQVNVNIPADLVDRLLKLTETRQPGTNR